MASGPIESHVLPAYAQSMSDAGGNSTQEKSRKKRGRKPGCQKTGGRKAGTPNKVTGQARQKLQECLAENGFDFGRELTSALLGRELEYAEILIKLVDYLFGKVPPQKPGEGDATAEDLGAPINLLELVK